MFCEFQYAGESIVRGRKVFHGLDISIRYSSLFSSSTTQTLACMCPHTFALYKIKFLNNHGLPIAIDSATFLAQPSLKLFVERSWYLLVRHHHSGV
jgi:hypothetical protein